VLGADRVFAAVRLLRPPPRHAGLEAALLSRARLLYAVLAPHRFGDRFFVPLAGVTDDDGQSPFWDALGRKFFKMDFLDAERVIGGARNRTLIVELMPHYPVYVPLLPGPAQAAMGQIHPSGQLAFDLLTEEGFEADEYIDIFDGGPILQAHKNALRSFRGSMVRAWRPRTSRRRAGGLSPGRLRRRQQRAQVPRHRRGLRRRPTAARRCACPRGAAGARRRARRQRHLRAHLKEENPCS
jgi:hypothetical protein